MEEAREGGLLDGYYDELSEEYDCPGVTWQRRETRRWGERHYSQQLQDQITQFKSENECPVSITWRARLK